MENGSNEIDDTWAFSFTYGNNNFTDDPDFDDPDNGDFHIPSDSPCKDAGGDVTNLPGTDFEGDRRNYNNIPDTGPDEYTG
jgi:hypothetical protein